MFVHHMAINQRFKRGVGVRFVCLPKKKIKRQHNLCCPSRKGRGKASNQCRLFYLVHTMDGTYFTIHHIGRLLRSIKMTSSSCAAPLLHCSLAASRLCLSLRSCSLSPFHACHASLSLAPTYTPICSLANIFSRQ